MPRKKEIEKESCCNAKWHHKHMGCGGGYCLGFIGAAIYFISTAGSFWIGVLGLLKAIVWPAILVYGLLKSLGM